MADDNGRNDVKSLAERQRNMVEVSDHFIKGSAVLAIAAFIFTGGMATVGKGGIWLAMGLSMVLTAVLVSVLGLMTLVRVVAVFETLIQSDPGESRLKRLVRKHGTWFLALLITCTVLGLAKNLGLIA